MFIKRCFILLVITSIFITNNTFSQIDQSLEELLNQLDNPIKNLNVIININKNIKKQIKKQISETSIKKVNQERLDTIKKKILEINESIKILEISENKTNNELKDLKSEPLVAVDDYMIDLADQVDLEETLKKITEQKEKLIQEKIKAATFENQLERINLTKDEKQKLHDKNIANIKNKAKELQKEKKTLELKLENNPKIFDKIINNLSDKTKIDATKKQKETNISDTKNNLNKNKDEIEKNKIQLKIEEKSNEQFNIYEFNKFLKKTITSNFGNETKTSGFTQKITKYIFISLAETFISYILFGIPLPAQTVNTIYSYLEKKYSIFSIMNPLTYTRWIAERIVPIILLLVTKTITTKLPLIGQIKFIKTLIERFNNLNSSVERGQITFINCILLITIMAIKSVLCSILSYQLLHIAETYIYPTLKSLGIDIKIIGPISLSNLFLLFIYYNQMLRYLHFHEINKVANFMQLPKELKDLYNNILKIFGKSNKQVDINQFLKGTQNETIIKLSSNVQHIVTFDNIKFVIELLKNITKIVISLSSKLGFKIQEDEILSNANLDNIFNQLNISQETNSNLIKDIINDANNRKEQINKITNEKEREERLIYWAMELNQQLALAQLKKEDRTNIIVEKFLSNLPKMTKQERDNFIENINKNYDEQVIKKFKKQIQKYSDQDNEAITKKIINFFKNAKPLVSIDDDSNEKRSDEYGLKTIKTEKAKQKLREAKEEAYKNPPKIINSINTPDQSSKTSWFNWW